MKTTTNRPAPAFSTPSAAMVAKAPLCDADRQMMFESVITSFGGGKLTNNHGMTLHAVEQMLMAAEPYPVDKLPPSNPAEWNAEFVRIANCKLPPKGNSR